MDLLPVIRKLLYREEGLIIPGLGGFISQYRPAEVHPDSGTFIPPAKEIVFNADVKALDGVLAEQVSAVAGISLDEAAENISKFVETVWKKLTHGERVYLDGIGFFYLDSMGTLRFQVDAGTNLLLDSFGFVPFNLKVVQEDKESIFNTSPIFRQAVPPVMVPLPGTVIPVEKSRTVRRLIFALPLLLIFSFMPYNSKVTRILTRQPVSLAPEPSLFRLDYPVPVKRDTTREIEYPIGDTTFISR